METCAHWHRLASSNMHANAVQVLEMYKDLTASLIQLGEEDPAGKGAAEAATEH